MGRARQTVVMAVASATILVAVPPGGVAPAAAQTQRPEAWRSDLATLVELLEARHPEPYHTLPRAEFADAVGRLRQRIPALDDHEIVVELARLMAQVGDGHTGVFIPWDFEYGRFPLELWSLEDGLLVAAASADHRELVGGRVVRMGDWQVERLIAATDSLLSVDNEFGRRGVRSLLVVPEVLEALGAIGDLQALPIVVETPAGTLHQDTVAARTRDASVDWRWLGGGAAPLPLWLRHREARYWFAPLPDARAVYFQYNDASWQDDDESLLEFTDRLVQHVTSHDVERVVVDLRWNDGGSDRWTNIVLHALVRIEHALGHPRTQDRDAGPPLFVLIGPETFSAATSFALDLEEHTNAVFVGEPTGGRPVGYGGQSFLDLPLTGTRARASFRYQISSFPGDDRAALFPHVAAPPTIAAYREGRDPALDAALDWRAERSVAERVADAAATADMAAVRAAWREWRDDPAHRWLEAESELNGLGYRLLRQEQVERAVLVFRLNAEAHPRSANAHDSLGEALAAAGRRDAAAAAYERAIALDPNGRIGAHARRMLEQVLADSNQEPEP